jgi:tripartite-type tricarboxylate transporter receptor subunit TctC
MMKISNPYWEPLKNNSKKIIKYIVLIIILFILLYIINSFLGNHKLSLNYINKELFAGPSPNTFPTKPITLVVPYPAGGKPDGIARPIANYMTKSLGQQVIVDNRGGTNGTVGTDIVAKSPPDGYTILINNINMATYPAALYKNLPFDPTYDFNYIGQVVDIPMVLIGHPSLPANDFKALIEYIRKNPEKLTIASPGIGSFPDLCSAIFNINYKLFTTRIPYKGTALPLQSLIAGEVDLLFCTIPEAIPNINSGKVKAFAVTTLKRSPALPNVPSLNEVGLSGLDVKYWYGMYVAKGTPPAIITKINAELKKALNDPDVQKKIDPLNIGIVPSNKNAPKDLETKLKKEIEIWGKIIKETGIKLDFNS